MRKKNNSYYMLKSFINSSRSAHERCQKAKSIEYEGSRAPIDSSIYRDKGRVRTYLVNSMKANINRDEDLRDVFIYLLYMLLRLDVLYFYTTASELRRSLL
jgi:hypothetical protein